MKGKLLLVIAGLHVLLFALFYKNMLSVDGAPLDKWFYVGYVCVVLITVVLFVVFKNKKSIYVATGVSCALVLGEFVGFYIFDRAGYKIDADDVEKIEYKVYGEYSKTVENDDVIKDIIEEYNDNNCIKRWEGGGQIGTPDKEIIIYMKDGIEISFTYDGVVPKDGKTYWSIFDFYKMVDYIENNSEYEAK